MATLVTAFLSASGSMSSGSPSRSQAIASPEAWALGGITVWCDGTARSSTSALLSQGSLKFRYTDKPCDRYQW
jgi:hypothetical protein